MDPWCATREVDTTSWGVCTNDCVVLSTICRDMGVPHVGCMRENCACPIGQVFMNGVCIDGATFCSRSGSIDSSVDIQCLEMGGGNTIGLIGDNSSHGCVIRGCRCNPGYVSVNGVCMLISCPANSFPDPTCINGHNTIGGIEIIGTINRTNGVRQCVNRGCRCNWCNSPQATPTTTGTGDSQVINPRTCTSNTGNPDPASGMACPTSGGGGWNHQGVNVGTFL